MFDILYREMIEIRQDLNTLSKIFDIKSSGYG